MDFLKWYGFVFSIISEIVLVISMITYPKNWIKNLVAGVLYLPFLIYFTLVLFF